MVRFMVVTFAFLAWAFYVMSGGAEFDPDRARLENAKNDPLMPVAKAEAGTRQLPGRNVEVTRVSLNLTSVENVQSAASEVPVPQQVAVPTRAAMATNGDAPATIPSLVQGATPEPVPAAADAANSGSIAVSVTSETAADIRVVSGSRVNVRNGPGTNYGVVDTLIRGDRVEVLDDSGSGWVRMRATDGGTVGWMADFLLTEG